MKTKKRAPPLTGLFGGFDHPDRSVCRRATPSGGAWGWAGAGAGSAMRNVPSPTDFVNQHALTRAAPRHARRRTGTTRMRTIPTPISTAFATMAWFRTTMRAAAGRRHLYARNEPNRPESAGRSKPYCCGRAADPSRGCRWRIFSTPRGSSSGRRIPRLTGLERKARVSDQASLAVLDETLRQSVASLSSVTDARQKLIEYGQPALQDDSAQATPVIADSFHRFMLSLYDALAQAAGPADLGLVVRLPFHRGNRGPHT